MMDTTRVVPNILGSLQNITKDKGIRNNKAVCPQCGGMGNIQDKNGKHICKYCHGTGVDPLQPDKSSRNNKKHECEKCGKMVNMLYKAPNGVMLCETCYDKLYGDE